ncbi:OmpA family protein [Salmonirosea aquatica]|uniref:OmpA family protein n=1 Tax=Salmonirosea aquatica TaxID=2654236 RepID=A0A7C9B9U7_9BACT|nr:OmpA family protein [Cytophagaceae bacterium SJW1-29]
MSTRNVPWWIALIVWMGLSTYWHVCKIKELCADPVTPQVVSEAVAMEALRIQDTDSLVLVSEGNFVFLKSGADAEMSQVRNELDSLVVYLQEHPGKRLALVGRYASVETNTTTFPDLGIARAESVKQYLVGQGLASGRIATSSMILDSLSFHNDTLRGGIDFIFKEPIPETEEGLANAQRFESVFKPIDLYFPTGSADYINTDANRQFVEEAQRYLAENKDKKLILTGHTDNEGDDEINMTLSRDRAEGVKKQLMQLGITADQLVTDGKGETQPKESNDTPEGRRANRRVAIVVQ